MIILKVPLFKTIRGMMLWPILLISDRKDLKDATFLNHERIHARQQLELLVIPFMLWYVIEYLYWRLLYNHDRAYRNIVFEREAYTYQHHLDYLKSRRSWGFLHFYANKYRV